MLFLTETICSHSKNKSQNEKPSGAGESPAKEFGMISRKELEELLGKPLTDEQWESNVKIMSKIEDEMWEEDHPLDE